MLKKNEADIEIATQITKYRDGTLRKLYWEIDSLVPDKPVEDFTEEENGFERGIFSALRIIKAKMHNKKLV